MSSAISVSNLTKSYEFFKRTKAVNDLSFEVSENRITGFLGPNGAGKTTTIYCILDLLFPDKGEIKVFGDSVCRSEIRARIGVKFDKPLFYGYLSGYETLKLRGRLNGMDKTAIKNKIEEITERFFLGDYIKKRTSAYSHGTFQKLAFAQAIISEPDLLIVDEPMAGLDPVVTGEVRKYILDYAKGEGKTVFISTHFLPEVERICNDIILIHKGKKLLYGQVQEILKGREKFRITGFREKIPADLTRLATIRREGGDIYDIIPKSKEISESDISRWFSSAETVVKMPASLEDIFFETVQ